MTLDEAIIHAEEIAEINENIAYNTDSENWMDIAQCEKCAEEHRQLAEWLKELKQFEWISVEDRLPEKRQVVLAIGKDSKTWDVGTFQGTAGWTDDKRMWLWKKKTVKRVDYWMPKDAIPLPYEGVIV